MHKLLEWIRSDVFPLWGEVKSLCPKIRFLWNRHNNLSADINGVIWRKRIVYWPVWVTGFTGLEWLTTWKIGWNSAQLAWRGSHPPVVITRWAIFPPVIAGTGYILVIADYFSKWTEAFPIKDKCADTVADVLVDKIILRFGMPLVIHSDQGLEFENGLMKSLCTLLGCAKTQTAPESDGMVERFNSTCLMMLSMFVNDRRDNWNELLPFVMHAYRTPFPPYDERGVFSTSRCLHGRATHKPGTWRGATPYCNLGTGRFGSCIWSCAPFATSHGRSTEETIRR